MNPTQGGRANSRSGQIPAQFYVDPEQWSRFHRVAQAQNRSRSAQIRELIRREIEQYEELEDAA